MAEKSASFGSFSSGVPLTQQMGQGLAQVFKPQILGLDTTSIQRAGQGIAEGISAAQAAKDKARAEKLSKINSFIDEQETYFPQTNAKLDDEISRFREEGDISDNAFSELKRRVKVITQTDAIAKQGADDARNKRGIYQNAKRFDEENLEYTDPLSAFDIMLNSEVDPNQDITEWQQNIFSTVTPVVNENILITEDLDEEDIKKALVDEINNIYKLRGEEKLLDVEEVDGRIATTTFKGLSNKDFQNAINNIKNNETYKSAFMVDRVFRDGNSPSALKDENAKEIYGQQYNEYIDELAKSYRPREVEVTTTQAPAKPKETPDKPKKEVDATGTLKVEGVGAEAKIESVGSFVDKTQTIRGTKVFGVEGKKGVRVPVLDSEGKQKMRKVEEGGVTQFEPITKVIEDEELYETYIRLSTETQEEANQIKSDLVKASKSVPVKEVRKSLIKDFTDKSGTFLGIEWDSNEDLINLLESKNYKVSKDLKSKIEDANLSKESSVAPIVDLLIKDNPGIVFELGQPESNLSPEEKFNQEWANAKSGDIVVGPDGKSYKKP